MFILRTFRLMAAAMALLALAACNGGADLAPGPVDYTAADNAATSRTAGFITAEALLEAAADPTAAIRPAKQSTGRYGLPSPRDLLRRTSATADSGRIRTGAQYSTALPASRAATDDDALRLRPMWTGAGDADVLAYALFSFDLREYDGEPQAAWSWYTPPASPADCLLGLGNLDGNRWDWYSVPADGELDLPELGRYLSTSDQLLAAVVAVGTADCVLNWLRIGTDFAPLARISADPTSGFAPIKIAFDATASVDIDGVITGYRWDLDGDGEFESVTGTVPTTTGQYETADVYTAVVEATDDYGNTATAGVEIRISSEANIPPEADLLAMPGNGTPPLNVTFNAQGSVDDDGDITLYEWDWEGDGTYDQITGTGMTSHQYWETGLYAPVVRVTDDAAATDTANASVHVVAGPTAIINLTIAEDPDSLSGHAPVGANADASGSIAPYGWIAEYEWDWDGDDTFEEYGGNEPTAQHGYITAGTVIPGVRVTDSMGETDTDQSDDLLAISGWSHSWGGSDADFYNGVWVNGNNIYCVGSTMSWGEGWSDGLLCKLNSHGQPQWSTVWGGAFVEYLVDVTTDAAGNPYTGGYTSSFAPGGGQDLLIIKYNPVGAVQWARTWGRDLNDWAHALVVGPGGAVIAAGETPNAEYSSMSDLVFISYDTGGNLQWAKTYNSGHDDNNPFITADAEGIITVTGRSTCGLNGIDGTIIRLSPSGELLSQQSWGGSQQDAFYRQAYDADGNLYVAGYTMSWSAGEEDALLIKFTPEGTIAWARTWGTTEPDITDSVHIGADGLVYACGLRVQHENDYYSLLLKYTPEGELAGAQQLTTSGTTKLWDGHSLGNGLFVMAGSTRNAYGTWETIEGTTGIPDAGLAPMTGEMTDAGGVHGEPEGIVCTPDNVVNDTGGGALDCLAVAYQTN